NQITLNGVVPQDVLVTLSSSDPGVTLPASITVPAYTTASPLFTINTSSVSAAKIVIISATYNGVTRTSNLTVNPLTATLVLSPSTVVGGVSATLNKVTLNGPAPAGGAVVTLSSGDPGVTVPGSVTVAAGSTVSPYFTITDPAGAVQGNVVISAVYSSVTKTANLTVIPVGLVSVTLSPASVVGGASATLNKVTLNGPAPAGGAVVTLSSGDPGVTVPGSVTVAAGSTVSPYFTITTTAVAAQSTAGISAVYNSVTKTANLTVNP